MAVTQKLRYSVRRPNGAEIASVVTNVSKVSDVSVENRDGSIHLVKGGRSIAHSERPLEDGERLVLVRKAADDKDATETVKAI